MPATKYFILQIKNSRQKIVLFGGEQMLLNGF